MGASEDLFTSGWYCFAFNRNALFISLSLAAEVIPSISKEKVNIKKCHRGMFFNLPYKSSFYSLNIIGEVRNDLLCIANIS